MNDKERVMQAVKMIAAARFRIKSALRSEISKAFEEVRAADALLRNVNVTRPGEIANKQETI